MAKPKNPPILLRIVRGTRIPGDEPGEMITMHPDDFGGPLIELKREVAADLVAGRRAEIVSGPPEYKRDILNKWQAAVSAGAKATAKAAK